MVAGISDQTEIKYDRSSVEDRITSIRILLRDKPNNARAMAKLACLIFSNETTIHQEEGCDHIVATSAAIQLAEKSIAVAPTKPYGYTAMSIVHPEFQVRLQALRTAIQQCTMKDQFNLALIDLLVRLMTEQRHERTRTETQRNGPSTSTNQVTNDERTMIEQVDALFHKVWKDPTVTQNIESIEFIGLREYRLGRFFRKLEPSSTYRSRSCRQFHFLRSTTRKQKPTPRGRFRNLNLLWHDSVAALDDSKVLIPYGHGVSVKLSE